MAPGPSRSGCRLLRRDRRSRASSPRGGSPATELAAAGGERRTRAQRVGRLPRQLLLASPRLAAAVPRRPARSQPLPRRLRRRRGERRRAAVPARLRRQDLDAAADSAASGSGSTRSAFRSSRSDSSTRSRCCRSRSRAIATSGAIFRAPLVVVLLFCLGCIAVLALGPRLVQLPFVHRSDRVERIVQTRRRSRRASPARRSSPAAFCSAAGRRERSAARCS